MQGQSDVALDETGVRQAHEAAPLLAAENPDAIVSSDLIRARVTAEALAGLLRLPWRWTSGCVRRTSVRGRG
jgi:broad specificity phosphatase PhoE